MDDLYLNRGRHGFALKDMVSGIICTSTEGVTDLSLKRGDQG